MSTSRDVYQTNYSPAQFTASTGDRYSRSVDEVRFKVVRRYGAGKDVLDLCCGSGAYLLPLLGIFKTAVGLDFAHNMLCGLRASARSKDVNRLVVVEADARQMPFGSACFDFVYSFASLYHVPEVGRAIAEVGRVLRQGGYCALELGNQHSLNTFVSEAGHRDLGWAEPHHISVRQMRALLEAAGLSPVEWRCFQLSPMYGAPRRHRWLFPLVTSNWRPIAALEVGGRMLDEWISSLPGLRSLAFRHLVIAQRV